MILIQKFKYIRIYKMPMISFFLSFSCFLFMIQFSFFSAVANEKIATGGGGEIVLVENCKSLAPIILPKDPTMYIKIAAKDLAEYIGKAGGAKPEIIEGAPNPVPAHAIWVGFQPKLKEVFPGTDFDFKHPEEILIKCDGKNLAIVGRDVWDAKINKISINAGKTDKERSSHLSGFVYANRDVEGFQYEYGTVNAVYSFLQDKLGVRWLWPGDDGEVVPKQGRIAFNPFEYSYYPKLRMRYGVFANFAIYRQAGGLGKTGGDWVRRQRVQLDSLYAPISGHGFGSDWYERFHDTHPEYLALQPDGTRDYTGPNPKVCDSNPEVWAQWVKQVGETVAKNPFRKIFNAAPNDAAQWGICLCEKCKSWDNPDAEKYSWLYPKKAPEKGVLIIPGVATADRQVTLANSCARLLKERFPGKDYMVTIHAYAVSANAPIKAIPDDNVIIASTARCLLDTDAPKNVAEYENWATKTKNLIWRPNTGDPANFKTGGPVEITAPGEMFKRMAKNAMGIYIDRFWSWWSTQGPLYYLLTQLDWNPSLSVDQIMDDYYRSGFGAAAGEIKDYFKLLENNSRAIMDYENKKVGKSWAQAFSPEFFKQAYALIGQAEKKTAGSADGCSRRVAFIKVGLDYLRVNTENRALAKQIIESKDPVPSLKEKMRANWKQLEKITSEFPDALYLNNTKETAYFHPETDHKAWAKEESLKLQALERKLKLYAGEPD